MEDKIPAYEKEGSLMTPTIFVPATGGWLNDSRPLTETEEGFNVYDTLSTDRRDKEEWELYDQYYVEYIENEWFSWMVDWLNTEIFSDMEFSGDGEEAVREFFNKTCPTAREEILKMGLNVIREGTGVLKKHIVDGKLRQIKAVNGRLVRLKIVENKRGGETTYYTGDAPDNAPMPSAAQWLEVTITSDDKFKRQLKLWPLTEPEEYRDEMIAVCKIKEDPRTPYGIGFGSTCLHIIKALKDLDRDVLAAVKQNAYNIKVMGIDLAAVDQPTDKLTELKRVAHAYRRVATATSGLLVIDKNNEIYYMGTGARGQGGASGGNRLLPVMEHIEPVLSALLMNFLFSLGLIEQTGANKSLIAKQEMRAEKQLRRYRQSVARFLETQIFPDITDQECKVLYEPQLEAVEWIALFQTSAISRERLLEEFSIRDKGSTYAHTLQPPMGGAGPTSPRSTTGGRAQSPQGSNDDNVATRRNTARSDTSTSRGA